jgi:hypothetical protein
MQKKQLIHLVIDRLAGGNTNSDLRGIYHPKIVEKQIENAFESLINPDQESIFAEIGLNNWKMDFCTKGYSLTVYYDALRDKYYSQLPVGITSINNNSGIRMIYPIKSEKDSFIPRAQTDNFLMGNLDVENLTDIVRYTYESNNQVYYSGNKDLLCRIHKQNEYVYAKLAVKFSELEDTDEINIPDGKNEAVFQYVMQAMMQTKPEDVTNNNLPDQQPI